MAPTKELNVLVTGFGPFRNFTVVNPSWLAAQQLNGISLPLSKPGYTANITALEVPTVYEDVLRMLPDFHANTHQPTKFDLVLHIGVSRPGSILNFELRARKAGYEKKDWHNNLADIVDEETGQRGFADPRYQALPDELHSPFLKHADEVVSKLKGDGVPIVTSTDAGLFLCEFIFYCSMAESQLAGRKTPVVFIHCPPVDDPMSTEAVADGVKRIIREVCSHSEFDSQI